MVNPQRPGPRARPLRILALAAGLALTLPPAAAAAQSDEPAADAATRAKTALEEGKQALEKGNLKRARALFQASEELSPAAATLLQLAACEEKLGLVRSALEHYRQALPLLKPIDRKDQALAKERIAQLEPRVPTLRLEAPASAVPGSRVLLDSLELPASSLGTDMPMDPGRYSVMVIAPGREERTIRVKLEPGKKETVTLDPGPPLAPPKPKATAAASAAPTAAPSELSPGTLRTLGIIVTTLGVLGLGAGFTGTALGLTIDDGPLGSPGGPREQLASASVVMAAAGMSLGIALTWTGIGLIGAASRPEGVQMHAAVSPGGSALTVSGMF